LWIGDRLSRMERMAIDSFLKKGNVFNLYVYDVPSGVPEGVKVLDASDVLPRGSIFTYGKSAVRDGSADGNYSAFSNLFRYKMLLDFGGCWVDTDLVCLRQFNFDEPYVFSSEQAYRGPIKINAGVIKVPSRGTPWADYCYRRCLDHDLDNVRWGELGPSLVSEAVKKFELEKYVKGSKVFCPVHYTQFEILVGNCDYVLPRESYAVHLWNGLWYRRNLDKDGSYHRKSLYERLKMNY